MVRMFSSITAWITFCTLFPFLLPVGAKIECTGKETLLRPIPRMMRRPTECLMECTGMVYIQKLQLQDNRNIRLKDSTEGDGGEYCWSTDLQCNTGESFHRAFVVLPVDTSAVTQDQLEVKSGAVTLHVHTSPATIADSCGLRYDVTHHFHTTENTEKLFCVQITAQQDLQVDGVLKCPPHLVPCCQPISEEAVPIVYMNEFSTVVISSVQLTRNCGCGPGDLQQLSED